MLAIRYVSAVVGVVTIRAAVSPLRLLFPLPAAVRSDELPQEWGASLIVRRFMPFVAALILAVLPWHNLFSRRGVEVILLPFWAILAVLFLWLGTRDGRWWPFVISGFFWGSAFYTYQAAWLLPGVLVLFLIYKVLQERGLPATLWLSACSSWRLTAILVACRWWYSAYRRTRPSSPNAADQVGVLVRGTRGRNAAVGPGAKCVEGGWCFPASAAIPISAITNGPGRRYH